MWTSAPVTRCTGASRWSKACSVISVARLAPTPPCGQPSSTITARLVLRTDSRIVSRSSGRSVRGSITSASPPCSLARTRAVGAALAPPSVEALVLDEDDRVVVADRRLQQRLAVGRGGGAGDEQSRHLQVERLEAVRVGGAELVATAARHPDHHRPPRVAVEHVGDRG